VTILRKAAKDEFDSPVERLLASIANLRQQPTGKGAHFFRTSLRRFEAWSGVFHPQINSEQKEALGFLDSLRKITGKLRDSDVHLELLDACAKGKSADNKKLAKALKARHKRFQRKLKTVLRDPILTGIWRALRTLDEPPQRTEHTVARPISGLHTLALDEYRAFVQRHGAVTPENIHEYRLQCKRFRYTAELAGPEEGAEELMQGWKTVQEVVGEWHDYLTLSELADDVLGSAPICDALTAITQQKYTAARDAVETLERKLIVKPAPAMKKQPRRVSTGRRTARTA
jgi:CHAD domain-containing protein